eukprot:4586009-Amphidinium_carterae.1
MSLVCSWVHTSLYLDISQQVLGVPALQKPSAKKTSGGTWRAFQRLHAAGASGLPNQHHMSEKYHAMKDAGGDEWETVQRLGEAARANAQSGGSGFGPSATRSKMNRTRSVLDSLWHALKECHGDMELQSDLILKHASNEQKGLTYVVRVADSMARRQGKERKQGRDNVTRTLQEYQTEVGASKITSLGLQVPDLEGHSFLPVPSGGVQCFELLDKSIPAASVSVGWMMNHKTSIAGKLTDSWSKSHYLVEAKDCDELPEAARKKPTICHEANMCLCSATGKKLKAFHDKIIEAFKVQFHNPEMKKLLATGHMVMQLSTKSDIVVPQSVALLHEMMEASHFFGVALMYFKPYRPTLERLLPTWD